MAALAAGWGCRNRSEPSRFVWVHAGEDGRIFRCLKHQSIRANLNAFSTAAIRAGRGRQPMVV